MPKLASDVSTLVKICGATTPEDALLAAQAGADYLGLIVEHPPSPRHVELEAACGICDALRTAGLSTPVVAVTVNLTFARLLEINRRLSPDIFQLHGDESAALVAELVQNGLQIWSTCGTGEAAVERAWQLHHAGTAAIVVDARAVRAGQTVFGGTGQTSDWSLARTLTEHGLRVVLSGGLTPENVSEAIAAAQPWMVDAVSGAEATPGVKDPVQLRRFLQAVKS